MRFNAVTAHNFAPSTWEEGRTLLWFARYVWLQNFIVKGKVFKMIQEAIYCMKFWTAEIRISSVKSNWTLITAQLDQSAWSLITKLLGKLTWSLVTKLLGYLGYVYNETNFLCCIIYCVLKTVVSTLWLTVFLSHVTNLLLKLSHCFLNRVPTVYYSPEENIVFQISRSYWGTKNVNLVLYCKVTIDGNISQGFHRVEYLYLGTRVPLLVKYTRCSVWDFVIVWT